MNRREYALDLDAPRFELGRQHESFAQTLDRLIERESWLHGRQLEEHAAGLSKVHRMEIVAIDHRRRMQPRRDDLLADVQLRRVVGHRPGNVMHRPRAADAGY